MVSQDSQNSNVVSAFTEDHVVRLTGLSRRQLRYWDRTGFFAPSLAYEDCRSPFSRLYSFRDLVCLKIVYALRNEANVSLPHLREVKDKLAHLGEDVWAKTTLYVLNRKVIFHNPETDRKEEVVSGQGILQIPLAVISGDMASAVKALWRREDASIGQIERHRGVAHNQAVIAGTRIPVRSVKAFAEAGYSIDQIMQEYPTLTAEDIRAALAYEAAA
jgi:uncharacterized protein (DUF433 family)/DNA-binding transcriptional MerR regulator